MYDVKLLESKSIKSKTLNIITQTLYERSKEESFHSEKVSHLCGMIGKEMGLDESMISELIILGKVHDIGKIGINQDILVKNEVLNESEWAEVKRHSEIGYHILVSSNEMAKAELLKCSGTQFDSNIVSIFIEKVLNNKI